MITRKKCELSYLPVREQFQTFDLGLSAALVSLGYSLWALDNAGTDTKKVQFIFKRSEGVEQTVEDYWNSKLKVTARTFFESQKMLKNRIYSE